MFLYFSWVLAPSYQLACCFQSTPISQSITGTACYLDAASHRSYYTIKKQLLDFGFAQLVCLKHYVMLQP